MAELVDALVSEASEATHGSSNLLGHTRLVEMVWYKRIEPFLLFFNDFLHYFTIFKGSWWSGSVTFTRKKGKWQYPLDHDSPH